MTAYLDWKVRTKKYCPVNTPRTTPGKTIAENRDVTANERGWGAWTTYKKTTSATGQQSTRYDFQDRVSRAHVMTRCTKHRIVRHFGPRAYQHRIRTVNMRCFGLSCTPTIPAGFTSDWKPDKAPYRQLLD